MELFCSVDPPGSGLQYSIQSDSRNASIHIRCNSPCGDWLSADKMHKHSPFIFGHLLLVIVGFVMIGWGNNTGRKLTGIFFL
jgi:hypothetical protein